MMIILCVLFSFVLANIEIEEIQEEAQTYLIHIGETATIQEIIKAEDAILTTFQDYSFCQVFQQTVQTETQMLNIIQEEDFINYQFENDTPINFRQFVGMVSVNDGMLAITSDFVAYLLKFNYDDVLSTKDSGFKIYGNDDNFAGVVWKANMKEVLPSLIAKSEIPQIIFAKQQNLAFVIFSDSAQYFSVKEMEENYKTMQLYTIISWRPRQIRGLTKAVDNYIFSAVGPDGLDIYLIKDGVSFIENIQARDIGLPQLQLVLIDYAIIKIDNNLYNLYLLDENYGLILVTLQFLKEKELVFKTIFINSENQPGGISIDTKNGINVFVAYQENGQYFYIEYLTNFINKTCEIITKQFSNYRIIDVVATDEFAILSGLNHHQIVFQNGYDFIAPHKDKIIFTQIGMRDFEFFKYSYSEEKLKAIKEDQYSYDDFFFGVTATNAFLTKFSFSPVRILCHSNNFNLTQQTQQYQIQYNTTITQNGLILNNKIQRTTQRLSVRLIKTYLFEDEFIPIYIMSGIVGFLLFFSCFILVCWWRKFRVEEMYLDSQIYDFKTKNTSNVSQLKMDDTISKQV